MEGEFSLVSPMWKRREKPSPAVPSSAMNPDIENRVTLVVNVPPVRTRRPPQRAGETVTPSPRVGYRRMQHQLHDMEKLVSARETNRRRFPDLTPEELPCQMTFTPTTLHVSAASTSRPLPRPAETVIPADQCPRVAPKRQTRHMIPSVDVYATVDDDLALRIAPALGETILYERLRRLRSATAADLFDGSVTVMDEILQSFAALLKHGVHTGPATLLAESLFASCTAALMMDPERGIAPEHTSTVIVAPSPRSTTKTSPDAALYSVLSSDDGFFDEAVLPSHKVAAQTEAIVTTLDDGSSDSTAPANWYKRVISVSKSGSPSLPPTVMSFKRMVVERNETMSAMLDEIRSLQEQVRVSVDMIEKYQRAYDTITRGGKAFVPQQVTADAGNEQTLVSPVSVGVMSPAEGCIANELRRASGAPRQSVVGVGSRAPSSAGFQLGDDGLISVTDTAPLLARCGSASLVSVVATAQQISPLEQQLAADIADLGDLSPLANMISGGDGKKPRNPFLNDAVQQHQATLAAAKALTAMSKNSSHGPKPVVQGASENIIKDLLLQNANLVRKVAEQASDIQTLRSHVEYLELQVTDLNQACVVMGTNNFVMSQQLKSALNGTHPLQTALQPSSVAMQPTAPLTTSAAAGSAPLSSQDSGPLGQTTQFYSPMLLDGRSAEMIAMQSNQEILKLLGTNARDDPVTNLQKTNSTVSGAQGSGTSNIRLTINSAAPGQGSSYNLRRRSTALDNPVTDTPIPSVFIKAPSM